MLRWDLINPVLIRLATEILRKPEAPTWQAQWLERSDANRLLNIQQGGALYLKVTSCVPIGEDESRFVMLTRDVDGEPVEDLYQVIVGFRRFVVQVQAWEAVTSDVQWAIATLEKLRLGFWRQAASDQLLAINVVHTDASASRDMTTSIDGRRWSVATMDLTFVGAFNADDPSAMPPVGNIEHIVLTSHVHDGVGTELPVPLSSGPETIPPLSS